MQAVAVPAASGWKWLREGFALYRKNPAAITFAVFSYVLILVLANSLPYVGVLLAPILMPALFSGVMHACRVISTGKLFLPNEIFAGFGAARGALLRLGGVYLGGTVGILLAVSPIDGGVLLRAMLLGEELSRDTLANPEFQLAVQVALALYAPLSLALWFSPMLAQWQGFPAGKALFFSFFAGLRNWRAFATYALGIVLVCILIPSVILAPFGSAGKEILSILALFVMLPLIFVFIPTIFASYYVSYSDIFGPETNDPAA